jgi:GNAT superfamily N-acetyltransferase
VRGGPGDRDATWSVRPIVRPEEVRDLALEDLSDWFNPLLGHFMVESLRCGGEVSVAERSSRVAGIYLYSPAEGLASTFTRSVEIASEFLRRHEGVPMYASFALVPHAEPFLVYSGAVGPEAPDERLVHAIRIAARADLPGASQLLREVNGNVDDRWIASMPISSERCFLAEIDGELAGAAFASLVGRRGRLHSLSVRPRYRRLGIGRDLFRARRMWLAAAGAGSILSEIAERNTPSRRIAERGGMTVAGRMFRNDPIGRTVAGPD